MAKLLKLRRGTTSQHSSFTGAEGEVTVDTTKDTVVVHDGSTAGGTPLAKESAVTAIPAVIDEDNMSSDSATRPPSQQSVKAYVDAIPDVIDEDNFASNSATRPPSQQSTKAYITNQNALKANINGQDFTGVVALKGTEQLHFFDAGDISNKISVKAPSLTADTTYILPTADGSAGQLLKTDGSGNLSWTTDSTLTLIDEDNMASNSATSVPSQQSTKAYVDAADATKAPLASPALTGTATAVNLELSGNLVVNGTTTTVATTNTTITDNLIELNSGASSNANDSGILIERGSTGDNAIFAWDESADKFIVGTTTGTASSTGDITIATGTLVANVEGTATTATNVVGVSNGSNTAYRVPFLSANSGTAAVYTDLSDGMTYNPSTNLLYVAGDFEDAKGSLRDIPVNAQSSAVTLATSDKGKVVATSSGGWVIPNNTFSGGNTITLLNNSNSDQNINASALGTALYNGADGANIKSNTIAVGARSMATIWFDSGTVAYIQGSSLTVS